MLIVTILVLIVYCEADVLMKNTCSFIGHKEIKETEELKENLYREIENLIVNKDVDTFLFGSRSQFDSLCLDVVSEIKEKYPHIKRIYVRGEYEIIDEKYKNYLLQFYEDTYYPERIRNAGRAVYVERNYEMIDKSRFCVFYYDESYAPLNRKSGTKIALDYAIKRNREIIIFS